MSVYSAVDGDTRREPPPPPVVDEGTLTMRRVLRWTWVGRINAWLGFLGTLAAIVLLCIAPTLIHDFLLDYVSIVSPESPLYNAWVNPQTVGVNTYRKYYFYNLTNPYEVVNGTAPHIVEVGPYVYTETTSKYDVRWYLNGTVGYKYQRIMSFVPEMSIDARSGRQLSDTDGNITIPNPALKGILYRVGKLSGGHFLDGAACTLLHKCMSGIVGPRAYFTQRPPHQILWGYIDEIWEEVHPLITVMDYTASTLFQSQWNGSAVVPSPYTYRTGQMCPLWNDQMACNGSAVDVTLEISGKHSDLHTPDSLRNVSAPGTWIPITKDGAWPPTWQAPVPVPVGPVHIDTSQHGIITSWAGQPSLWWWGPMIDGITGGNETVRGDSYSPQNVTPELPPAGVKGPEECRVVRGTDGVRFPPFLTSESKPSLFVDMIGRSFPLAHNGTVDYMGVTADRFVLDPEVFTSSDKNRYCFSQRFNGFLNTSRPAFGPGVASQSYYLGTCLFDDGALLKGDSNGARRCVDPQWQGPNQPSDNNDDDFTGKQMTMNLTWGIATADDPYAQRAPRLSLDQYVKATFGVAPDSFEARNAVQSYVSVHAMCGVTLQGYADATISLELGPYSVDHCGTNWTFLNHTFHYFNHTERMVQTVIPFLRVVREAEATGHWVDKLKADLRLIAIFHILTWVLLAVSICVFLFGIWVSGHYVPRIAMGDPSQYDRDPELERLAASLTDGQSQRSSRVQT